MTEFKITGEYIHLNKLLKVLGFAATGGHAKILIEDGEVMVNDKIEHRLRNKIRPGDIVAVGDEKCKIS
ncbi:MAG: ribosome-associated protein [Patiriisocius sp.]|jgi:ribosome-associated protein